MKQLIVNADDLGADESRNAGIFEAIEAGSVTSVSILPNGPALGDAVRTIHSQKLTRISFGVHLNLSEGKPLESGLRRLVGRDGCFMGKPRAQRLLLHRGDSELEKEIRRELSAQIARIRDAGISVDHLDGHQHVHVFPSVVIAGAETARMQEIPWVRIPEEPLPDFWIRAASSKLIEEAGFFSQHGAAARAYYEGMGIRTTDNFRGLYLKGELPADEWEGFLESIPSGITELMVHPGHFRAEIAGPFAGFSTADRKKELSALTDGRFLAALLKEGIQLTRFPDIQKDLRCVS